MSAVEYQYASEPTHNPIRYLRAVWRLIRNDPTRELGSAAIVELGFARSRLGRRFARWEEPIAALKVDPRTAPAVNARRSFGPIVLADLEALPEGSLGRVFADHCRARGLDPNLIHVPPTDEVGWMLNHIFQTHDIWHVVTGWGNDLAGEAGLGAFYAAQLHGPPFFGYMLALGFLNVVMRRANLTEIFEAVSIGYQGGQHSEPLFGVDWDTLWDVPLEEVRARFAIDREAIVGEGIRAAA